MTRDELLHHLAVVVADTDSDAEPTDEAVTSLDALQRAVDSRDPDDRPALSVSSVEARFHAIIEAR